MKVKYSLILSLIFVLVFSHNVFSNDYYTIYYYTNTDFGEEILNEKNYSFNGEFTLEEKAYILLSKLFDNTFKDINFIPSNSNILDINFKKGELVVNFNEQILNYGGTYYENKLIYQILKTLFSLEKVEFVTFHINGELAIFSEGSTVFKFTRDILV